MAAIAGRATESNGLQCSSNRASYFAVGIRYRNVMQGWFSQIIIGVVVTVLGTIIANAITGSRAGHHFVPSFYSSRH